MMIALLKSITPVRRNITLVTIHLGIVTHILLGTTTAITIIHHITLLNLITIHLHDSMDVITIIVMLFTIISISFGNINLYPPSAKLLEAIVSE